MAIDETLLQETNALTLPSPRIFYPAQISVRHWQLRQLISSPEPHIVIYASDRNIYRLNTSARTRELISILTFSPRCLDAKHGWVCVGGDDKGRFAFLRYDQRDDELLPMDTREDTPSQFAEVDTLLPLDLDPSPIRETTSTRGMLIPRACPRPSNTRPEVRIQEHGGEIVNSVSIHQVRQHDPKKADIVAVLTNNDKTVRIFSLTRSCVVRTMEFPFPMNHAQISPDGEQLVVVGDKPVVYFYGRIPLEDPEDTSDSSHMVKDWELVAHLRLRAVHDSGCFSTAYSPSGHLCAVASEDGVVTIFNTKLLGNTDDEEEAVVEIIRSSRPRCKAGAIRSMIFSPEPWDLLFLIEDQDRICVIDLRTGFRTRQTIQLDSEAEDLEHADISDIADSQVDPQLLESTLAIDYLRDYQRTMPVNLQDDDPGVPSTHSVSTNSANIRQHLRARNAGEENSATLPGLTEDEQQILDAIRTSRERRDALEQLQRPYSVHYMPPPSTRREGSAGPNNGSENEATYARSNRSMISLRNYLRERTAENANTSNERVYYPRRRSSIFLPENEPSAETETTTDQSRPHLTVSPPRIGSSDEGSSSSDPWRTIQAAMASGRLSDAAARIRREREATIEANFERRQRLAEHVRRERARNAAMSPLPELSRAVNRYDADDIPFARMFGGFENLNSGHGTAGVAVSADGRTLYVGTIKGIFEFRVNIHGRQQFPLITQK